MALLDDAENTQMRPLTNSFYSRKSKTRKTVKRIRGDIAKEFVNRPQIGMTMDQYLYLKELYRGDEFTSVKRRTLLKNEEDFKDTAKTAVNTTASPNRKGYMTSTEDDMSSAKANQLYRGITSTDLTDADMLGFINEIEKAFEEKCHYRNIVYKDIARITRNNEEGMEVVSIIFISKAAAALFENNIHILYLDASHSSDFGCIYLAVFMDCNHMVQPLGFMLSSSESVNNWTKFLMALKDSGVNFNDLVINSDRHEAIIQAERTVLPSAEHAHCIVHIERNIQLKWSKTYGTFSSKNRDKVVTFNDIMQDFNHARLAITDAECKRYLKLIKMKEKEFSHTDETPIADYISDNEGVYMYKWHFNHLMQVTTNPVEICMKELKDSRYGLKDCRSETMLNKYRYLVRWIYERIEKRHRGLKEGSRIPISQISKIPCPYIEEHIRKLAHFFECYKDHFDIRTSTDNRDITGSLTNIFNVYDKDYKTVYTVKLREVSCSCHVPYWSKLPCLHIIAVLHSRQEYTRVWSMIGSMYLINEVSKSCRELTKEEREVIKSIVVNNREEVEVNQPVDYELLNNRGRTVRNSHRIPSSGELNDN